MNKPTTFKSNSYTAKMANSSNLGLLFFVVAIIYLLFLLVLIVRSAFPIFSCSQYPNNKQMKIFRAFYGSLWLQMILNSALYWVLFANEINDSGEAKHNEGFKSVVLVFLPTILMSLDYALMYFALDDMQKKSRI